jgi:uncharacterized protein YprB with RNaseH-like and TPR domain
MTVDLRERLRRALGSSRLAGAPDRYEPASEPAADPRADRSSLRQRDIHDLVPGSIVEGPLGACFVAERAFALEHQHGCESLGGFFGVSDRGLGCLARSAVPLDLDRESILFLDTETTGLSGGTGTYVFMVGVGYFRGEQFVVQQFFMRHHAEEPALLALLNGLIGRFEAVVTFNGKSFDMPLLLTRYAQNRQRPTLQVSHHLDLLHPARRFWRERLESCSLGMLEGAILGHERVRDVPSWMIPELYFQYVRGGAPEAMARVFAHNLDDILSLVAVACRLGRLLDDEAQSEHDAQDLFAAGRIFEDLGLVDAACDRYERALTAGRNVALRAQVAGRLAALCKRLGRQDRAIQLWQRLATLRLTGCEPHVELAKHYEHRLRDYAAAIAMVEEALAIVELRRLRRLSGAAAERRELERRLGRLLAKQARIRSAAESRRQVSSAPEGSSLAVGD